MTKSISLGLWDEPQESLAVEEFSSGWYVQRGGELYLELKFARALREYARATDTDRKIESGWVGQAACLLRLGQFAQVCTLCRTGRDFFPKSVALFSLEAAGTGGQGKVEEALRLSDLALSYPGDVPLEWLCRGEVLLAVGGQEVPARRCFVHALEVASRSALVDREIALIYYAHNQFEASCAHFEAALKAQQPAAEFWYRYALCMVKLGRRKAAREALEQAVAAEPLNNVYNEALRRLAPHKGLRGWVGRLLKRD